MEKYRIRCAEIWGGVDAADLDVCTSGMCASVYSKSCAGEKGGDIYYLSVCGMDQLTRVALADLQGHGEQVSQLGRWVYDSLLESMSSLNATGILTDLNGLVRSKGFEAITTAAVVSYYLGNSTLYFSYAGHPPMFLKRRAEETWRALPLDTADERSNMPLGIVPEARYEQAELPLAAGDRLFLYTDGVTDCPDAADEFFGEDRLLQALNATIGADVSNVKRSVLAALEEHAGGPLTHDDITFMVMEIT